jgi:hypothetical protein
MHQGVTSVSPDNYTYQPIAKQYDTVAFFGSSSAAITFSH